MDWSLATVDNIIVDNVVIQRDLYWHADSGNLQNYG
jgi:hypothetical protein